MADKVVPEHVFISYSHVDKEFANKLATDLRRAGISIWIDRTGLQPGTPNWNTAICDALQRSFAVLLLASPSSNQSDVVQGEVNLSKSYGCPVYPVWIAGKWEDSIPLAMMQTQYIDCREAGYVLGLSQLVETLLKIINTRAIKHFQFLSDVNFRIPQGYLVISLADQPNSVAFRPSSYQSLKSLLDDLYIHYLASQYRPFTYGKEWIIASNNYERISYDFVPSGPNRLLVPWNWLLEEDDHLPISRYYPSWQLSPLATYGLEVGTYWQIIDKLTIPAFGIATNESILAKYIYTMSYDWQRQGDGFRKIALYLEDTFYRDALSNDDAYMKLSDIEDFNPQDYIFLFVFVSNEPLTPFTKRKVFIPGSKWINDKRYYFNDAF